MKKHSPLSAILFLGATHLASASLFTVGPTTPDVTGGGIPPADDVLIPGGVTPPTPALPGFTMGGNVDGFSFNGAAGPITSWEFSVDAFATGVGGSAVSVEVGPGFPVAEAHTDIFATTLGGTNTLTFDGNGSSAPGLGLFEPGIFVMGDVFGVNGVDSSAAVPAGLIYWTVDGPSTTTLPPYAGTSPADIWIAPAAAGFATGPTPFAPGFLLGLAPGDNIDGLHVVDVGTIGAYDPADSIYFSLDPASPSLGPFGPGDIFLATGGVPFILHAPAGALGLAPGDNLNALSGIVAVPEPAEISVLALGVLGLTVARRRKRVGAAA